MRKIISLFEKNRGGDNQARNEVTPGAEWVIAGEGVPTRKYDGTCCMIRGSRLFKRFSVKGLTPPPVNFEPATGVDENTGIRQGWVPVGDGPDDRWHREAFEIGVDLSGFPLLEGTYELCGPKIQGNAESLSRHVLIRHGKDVIASNPRDFESIREFLRTANMEGIIWHHSDGRMVKIKARDFGLTR